MGQYSGLPLVCQLSIGLKSRINPEYSLNLVTFGTDKNPAQTGLTFKTGKYGKGFHDGAPAILIKGQTRGPAPTRNLFPIEG